jgi:hypothetical protein
VLFIQPQDHIHNTSLCSLFTNCPNILEYLPLTSLSRLALSNILAYCTPSIVTKNIKCCVYSPRDHIHNTSFCSQFTNCPNILEYLPLTSLSRLALSNILAYFTPSLVTNKIKCCVYSPRDHIHNTSFCLKFTNSLNILEYLSLTSLSRLALSNILAYCIHSLVTKKIKCCIYSPRDHIHNTSYSSQFTNCPNML